MKLPTFLSIFLLGLAPCLAMEKVGIPDDKPSSVESFKLTSIYTENGLNYVDISTCPILNFHYKKMGLEGVEELSPALEENTNLTSLNIGANILRDSGLGVLARALKNKTKLTDLNFSRDIYSDEGVQLITDIVINSFSSLTTLNLSHIGVSDKGLSIFTQALKGNTTLTSLNLSYNYFADEGVCRLVDVLTGNTTLVSLDLEHNDIHEEGAEALSTLLENNQNGALKFLNLAKNERLGDGVKFLAKVLPYNTTLTSLCLLRIEPSIDGLTALAEALRRNSTLTHLELGQNYDVDTEEVLRALYEALLENSTLKVLVLRITELRDDWAEKFKTLRSTLQISITL